MIVTGCLGRPSYDLLDEPSPLPCQACVDNAYTSKWTREMNQYMTAAHVYSTMLDRRAQLQHAEYSQPKG